MKRIFHQRFTLASKCSLVLFTSLLAFTAWHKMAIVSAVLAVMVLIIIERVIHTSYTFDGQRATGEGEPVECLTIDRGRFSSALIIPLNEIVSVAPMKAVFGLSRYLLISYGNRRLVSVEPENDEAFLAELRKRQQAVDAKIKNSKE